ncbi:hypothetical protein NL676_013726 [Syzygium grande]|nr:hypothetical protein NL676_013726 [Syzygium grande]
MDDINAGHERLAELQVRKVNGIEIENLRHLYQLVEHYNGESIQFDLDEAKIEEATHPAPRKENVARKGRRS